MLLFNSSIFNVVLTQELGAEKITTEAAIGQKCQNSLVWPYDERNKYVTLARTKNADGAIYSIIWKD